jgi:hypothetical protein
MTKRELLKELEPFPEDVEILIRGCRKLFQRRSVLTVQVEWLTKTVKYGWGNSSFGDIPTRTVVIN